MVHIRLNDGCWPQLLLLLVPPSIITILCVWDMMKPGVGHLRYVLNRVWWRLVRGDRGETCAWCKRMYGINKRHAHGSVCCSRKCERELHEYAHQRVRPNNRCEVHTHCRITYRGTCWKCWCDSWVSSHVRRRAERTTLMLLSGFRYMPVLSDSSRQGQDLQTMDRLAVDLWLKERKIKCFVYVKFYVTRRGTVRPIVVGKSASTLVNATGSDISFSMDPKDGRARRWLLKRGLNWYHDYVLVKAVSGLDEAYALEQKMMRRFGLLGS